MTGGSFFVFPLLAAAGWLSWTGWWVLLAGTLALSAVHLGSMLSTRWGDRWEGPKSFAFSVLAHVALLCGVFAAAPSLDRMLGEPAERRATADRRFQIGEVRLDAADAPAPDRDPLPWRDPDSPGPRPTERADAAALADSAPASAAVDRTRPEFARDAAPLASDARPAEIPDLPLPDPVAPAVEEPALADLPAPDEPLVPAMTADPAPRPRRALPDSGPSATAGATRVRPERSPARSRPALTERRRLAEDPFAVEGPAPALAAAPADAAAAPAVDAAIPEGPRADETPVPRRSRLPDAPALAERSPRPSRTRPADAAPRRFGGLTERRRDRPDVGPDAGPEAVVSAESPADLPAPGVPDAYRLRDLTRRSEVARRYGGTAESEAAVERALAWFARRQRPDGRWDGAAHAAGRGTTDQTAEDEPDPDKRQTGRKADTGLTGLVTLSFLGAGYTRSAGRYAPAVDRAVRYLVSQQDRDGSLGGKANYYARMYCHGIATYALAEALALEGDRADPALRRAVENAIGFIAAQQYPDGGWRYSQRYRVGDMSMFGWQCLALKSAENAGVPMPAGTRDGMIRFLKARSETREPAGRLTQAEFGGLARYVPKAGEEVKPSMTAEALFCKQMLGVRRDNPASLEAVDYLDGFSPDLRGWNMYHWYYATLALHQHGGPAWDRWNAALRELLLAEQATSGPDAGAWPVRSTEMNFTAYGGRLYSTAMATLCLEVYYRFTPAAGGAAAMDGRGD